MRTLAGLLIVLLFGTSSFARAGDINLGLGLDYTLMGKLHYDNVPGADYAFFDNIFWQGRASYSFDNGFQTGLLFTYFNKTIEPGAATRDELSAWGTGVWGDYGYGITESGNTLLVGGMEVGYGQLSDKTRTFTKSGGAVWIAALAGTRFRVIGKASLELDYRLAWQEYELATSPKRWYNFAGSSLRLALDYPIFSRPEKPEDE